MTRIGSIPDPHLLKQKMLVEKFAGRIVIFERKARAGDAVIIGRIVEERDRCLLLGAAHISDLYGERLRRCKRCGQEQNQSAGNDCPDQGSTPGLRSRISVSIAFLERAACSAG